MSPYCVIPPGYIPFIGSFRNRQNEPVVIEIRTGVGKGGGVKGGEQTN